VVASEGGFATDAARVDLDQLGRLELGEGCFDRHLHEASAHDGHVDGSIGERMFDAGVIAFWASRSTLRRASSSSRDSPLNPRIRGGTSIRHGTESGGAGGAGSGLLMCSSSMG
jgi:hypothetical protein